MNESDAIGSAAWNPAVVIFWVSVALWLLGSFGFSLALAYSGPGDLLWIILPLQLILWVVPAVAVLIAMAQLFRGAYLRTLAPLAVVAAAVTLYFHGPYLGTWLRFEIERPGYLSRIEKARAGSFDRAVAAGSPTIAFFPWHNALLDEDGVVYDEADAMVAPLRARQQQWRERQIPGYLRCDAAITSLGGHFYFATFYC